MDGYRLRSSHGDTIDPRQPLPIDTVEAQQTVSQSDTLTYNGKASAGAVTVNALPYKPIISVEGDQVASYWGESQNKVFEAYFEGNQNAGNAWLQSVIETNGSAAFTVSAPSQNLEEMFESVTGTVKRFIAKLIDTDGNVLYGWIMGVSVSSGVYTFNVMNHRTTETQNWVGTLASFDNTALEKVEIYHYNSSIAFGTETTLTEEVACPKEYSKDWFRILKYAETLSNGQYFVDYMRGRIVGVKADTTASETVTYNIWSSLASGGTVTTSNVNIDKVGGDSTVNGGVAGTLGIGGSTAEDSAYASNPVGIGAEAKSSRKTAVSDGDVVRLVANLYGELITAGYINSTESIQTTLLNPNYEQFAGSKPADVTNGTDGTYEYYIDRASFRKLGLQLTLDGGSGTVTVKVYGTKQDDGTSASSCAYQDIGNDVFGSTSWTTDAMLDDTSGATGLYKYLKIEVVASTGGSNDADWTIDAKQLY